MAEKELCGEEQEERLLFINQFPVGTMVRIMPKPASVAGNTESGGVYNHQVLNVPVRLSLPQGSLEKGEVLWVDISRIINY